MYSGNDVESWFSGYYWLERKLIHQWAGAGWFVWKDFLNGKMRKRQNDFFISKPIL